MGNALESHRGSALDEQFCHAALLCSETNTIWTTDMLRDCCKRHNEIMTPGSFRLNRQAFYDLFSFLQPPTQHHRKKKLVSTTTTTNPSNNNKATPHKLQKSSSMPIINKTKQKKKLHRTKTDKLDRMMKHSFNRNQKIERANNSLSKRSSPTKPNKKNNFNNKPGKDTTAASKNNIQHKNNTTTKQSQQSNTNKNNTNTPSSTTKRNNNFLKDPRDILFNALRQRSSGTNKPRHQSHHECSFFVAAAALALSANSTMENRLHFLFDLFHPYNGYGGVVTPTDMESGSKLLNLRELSFLTFTTLRALSGIMHGQLDHVRTGSHEIKHSVVTLVKNMELLVRGFNHHDGFSWLDFEKFVHLLVLPGAPWLYGVLDNAISLNNEDTLLDSPKKKNKDPYRRQNSNQKQNNERKDNEQKETKKIEYGKRATKFRLDSKGLLEISIISLASQSGGTHTHADRSQTTVATGGTAFTAHLRPILNKTMQKMARKTKPKSLDGAGIVSWNTKVTFTDTGEGKEAAERSWSYGLDIELRVGETVCGGCFVDMYTLLDSGQFGMQVPVRSARKRDKISWGGGVIGKIRISANHVTRKSLDEAEKIREDQLKQEQENQRKREEEEAAEDY